MRLVLAALLALGAVPAQAGPVVSGRVSAPATAGVAIGNIRAAGATVSVPSVSLTAALTLSLSPSLAPALPALHSAPSLPADEAAASPAASLQAAVPAPSARSAAPSAPRHAPAGLAAALAASAEAPKPGAQESARESLDAAAEKAAAPRAEGEGAEAGKLSGDARFDGAGRKDALSGKPAPSEEPVPPGRWLRRRSGLGSAATLAGGGALLAATGPTQAVPVPNVPDAVAAELAQAAQGGLLHAVGQTGYVVGNALAFIFPLFEIYRAYKTGSAAAMPKARAALLMGASLAVGLFVLTLSGLPVWAIQNIFGALALGVVWPSAWAARKLGVASEGQGVSAKAVAATLVTAAAALGASAALYYLVAAPFVPMLITATFGAAAIGAITLGIQVAAAAVQAFLFAPDLIKLMRGQAAQGGFSPGFTLALTLASLSFVVYSAVRLAGAPWGSTSMWQFALYTGLYLLYTVTSGATWWLGRKRAPRNN
jgi:hypothetical protein